MANWRVGTGSPVLKSNIAIEREHLLPLPQRTDGNYVFIREHVEAVRSSALPQPLTWRGRPFASLIGAGRQPERWRTVNALLDEKMPRLIAAGR